MKVIQKLSLASATLALLYLAASILCGTAWTQVNKSGDHAIIVRGLVRDIACPIQNKQSTSRVFNKQCAIACARQGSPIGILTDDGSFYLAISDGMPDKSQNKKLMPFVGKYVEASGTVFERTGSHALMIKEIHEDKSVRLKDNPE